MPNPMLMLDADKKKPMGWKAPNAKGADPLPKLAKPKIGPQMGLVVALRAGASNAGGAAVGHHPYGKRGAKGT